MSGDLWLPVGVTDYVGLGDWQSVPLVHGKAVSHLAFKSRRFLRYYKPLLDLSQRHSVLRWVLFGLNGFTFESKLVVITSESGLSSTLFNRDFFEILSSRALHWDLNGKRVGTPGLQRNPGKLVAAPHPVNATRGVTAYPLESPRSVPAGRDPRALATLIT